MIKNCRKKSIATIQNKINTVIIFWIVAIDFSSQIIHLILRPDQAEKYDFVAYLSPKVFLISPLQFSDDIYKKINYSNGTSITLYSQDVNFTLIGILTALMPFIFIGLFFLNNNIFAKKDLNV